MFQKKPFILLHQMDWKRQGHFDLIGFRESFDFTYKAPSRKPKLGLYKMAVGFLMPLFIGFNRIWHFSYLQLDAMLCGFFQLSCLPVASTF